MLPREIILLLERYIAIPAVVWLISQGIFDSSQQDALVEIVNHILTGVTLFVLYYLSHKSKTESPTENRVAHFFKSLLSRFIEKKTPTTLQQ